MVGELLKAYSYRTNAFPPLFCGVNNTTIDSGCDVKETDVGASGIVYGMTELVLVADKEFPRAFHACNNT